MRRTLTARTGEDEVSNVVLENGTPGYEISAPCTSSAGRRRTPASSPSRTARCPEENLLGPRGRGFNQFLEILDGGRISVAAMGVGLAQGAYDLAFAYARERTQFGKPIGRFQAVSFKLADMAAEIEAGRQLVYKAAWLKDQGRSFALEAAMAKLYTGDSRIASSTMRSRSTAATGSWTSSRSRACTGTRRSSRSVRGRTRCSGW